MNQNNVLMGVMCMKVYEYGVEFTQYDEYEDREISEKTTLYFKFIPEISDIHDRLFDKGYEVSQLLDYVMLREIQD